MIVSCSSIKAYVISLFFPALLLGRRLKMTALQINIDWVFMVKT